MKVSVRDNHNKIGTSKSRGNKTTEKPNNLGFFDAVCEVSNGSSKKYNKNYDYLDGGTF